ncbi:hypothetical protein AV530_011050 [Patagioenas fasciata monilis]|uniref:Integrin beta n=1 Tax=Patagioenas fasciata monilis TaxID=372326 RepID=A0A1V4J510_PATFA|nr:hypothetical protein AV530_011050 [Patagioenas fasciata monilis]
MRDDLGTLRRLARDILGTLRNATPSARIGFGSFVDKPVLPYVSTAPAKLRSPCPERGEPCDPPRAFRHLLALTGDPELFAQRVGRQRVSGNLDAAEGGFDAIVQVALCQHKKGGWGWGELGPNRNQVRLGWDETELDQDRPGRTGTNWAELGPAGAELEPGDGPQEGSPPTPPSRPPPPDGQDELETAPCRGHLAAALQELRAGLYRSAADIFLPNCDTRGFYRPKQCRASQGPKRGQCWCVDRRGHPLAGTEGHGGAARCPPA